MLFKPITSFCKRLQACINTGDTGSELIGKVVDESSDLAGRFITEQVEMLVDRYKVRVKAETEVEETVGREVT